MYILPQMVVYQDANFINNNYWSFNMPPGWGWNYVGDDWNDRISSVVILSGTWQFFEHAGFGGASAHVCPGEAQFHAAAQLDMQQDTSSSVLFLAAQPQGGHPVAVF